MNPLQYPRLAVGMHLEYISPDNPQYGIHCKIVHTQVDHIVVDRFWHGNHGRATLRGAVEIRLVKYTNGSCVPEPLASQWIAVQRCSMVNATSALAWGG